MNESTVSILIQIGAAIGTLTFIGATFGIVLSIAHKKLKVEQDPRIDKMIEVLSGANCGACGYPGCSAYAVAVLNEGADPSLCIVGGQEVADQIAEIIGVEAVCSSPKIARVHCRGGEENTVQKFTYTGPKSCSAAQQVNGGFRVCSYGCLGFGDCVKVCPFDAISMNENKIPVVDNEKCTGCGKCILECPRCIITLDNSSCEHYVICNNTEKALEMKKGCHVGCIGCKLCDIKACKLEFAENNDIESAITMKDGYLAVIDSDICTNCGQCPSVCPQKVIHSPSKIHEQFKVKK